MSKIASNIINLDDIAWNKVTSIIEIFTVEQNKWNAELRTLTSKTKELNGTLRDHINRSRPLNDETKSLHNAHFDLLERHLNSGLTEKENVLHKLLEIFQLFPADGDLNSIKKIHYSGFILELETINSVEVFAIIAPNTNTEGLFENLINQTISSLVDDIKATYAEDDGLAYIDTMTGQEFERHIVTILINEGFNARVSGKSGDLGVDIIAEKDGLRYAIQCKRQSNFVSRHAVSDAVAGIGQYECDQAMVITNNFFSPGAKQLAKANNCVLIDRDQLTEFIKRLRNV
jgi:HJR/Mrr/RecB family endonuclease